MAIDAPLATAAAAAERPSSRRRFPGVLAVVLALAVPSVDARDRYFIGSEPVELPAPASSLLYQDLDGDGWRDLALPHGSRTYVSILWGREDGAFEAPSRIETGLGPTLIAPGDFDGDARPDLVVAHSGSSSAVILRRTEARRFEPAPAFPLGGDPSSLVTGDFDGDGRVDAATTATASPDIEIHHGDGRGGVRTTRVALDGSSLRLAAGDVDGDGIDDIAATHVTSAGGSALSIHHGARDDGEPAEPRQVPLPGPALGARVLERAVVVLLEDRCLAVRSPPGEASGIIAETRANPGESFSAPLVAGERGPHSRGLVVFPSVFGGLAHVRALFLDGDALPSAWRVSVGARAPTLLGHGAPATPRGEVTLLWGDASRPRLSLRRGSAGDAPDDAEHAALGFQVQRLAVVDVDGDGVRDVLAQGSGSLATIRWDDGPSVPIVSSVPPPPVLWPPGSSLPFTTLDVVGRRDPNTIEVILGAAIDSPIVSPSGAIVVLGIDSGGEVVDPITIDLGSIGGALRMADLGDGDRRLAVAADRSESELLVLVGSPGRFPQETRRIALDAPAESLAVADLDGDGTADIALGQRDSLTLLRGDGSGEFVEWRRVAAASTIEALFVGSNLLGAGADLLVVGSAGVGILSDALGDGEIRDGVAITAPPRSLVAIDLDDDDDAELLALHSTSPRVDVWTMTEGGYELAESYAVGTGAAHLEVADLEGDGDIEALVAENEGGTLAVLRAGPRQRRPAGPTFRRGDVDGDGVGRLTDAIVILGSLFLGTGALPCADAGDVNDDGILNLTDPLVLLAHLFQGGAPPAPPGWSACGHDATPDDLTECGDVCP